MFQFKRLKEWHQSWSIQFIPMKKGNVKRIQMPLWGIASLFFSIGMFVATTLLASYFLWYKTVDLESELVQMETYHVENIELTKEVESMENEIVEMENQLNHIYQEINNLDSWLKQLEEMYQEVDTLYNILPPILQNELQLYSKSTKEQNTVRISSLDKNFEQGNFSELNNLRNSLDHLYSRAQKQEEEITIVKEELQKKITEAHFIPSIHPAQGRITSTFGLRKDPFSRRQSLHLGLDIANQYLTPILATADGTVLSAERKGGYGRSIYLDHGNGYRTLYAHLAKIDVEVGETVEQGMVIGYMGSSGRSTGVHLHYEVHKDGTPVDPAHYLN